MPLELQERGELALVLGEAFLEVLEVRVGMRGTLDHVLELVKPRQALTKGRFGGNGGHGGRSIVRLRHTKTMGRVRGAAPKGSRESVLDNILDKSTTYGRFR